MSQDNPFASALRAAVSRINDGFEEADRALHDAVAEASEGIREFTNGAEVLRLDLRNDSTEGRLYDLVVMPVGSSFGHTLDTFLVPTKGFPLRYGQAMGSALITRGQLSDPTAIYDHLLAQVNNPDSPLAVYLAYQLRKTDKG